MSDLRKVYMMPTPSQALASPINSINQIVLRLQKHLPAYGYELTDDPQQAALTVSHAGANAGKSADVAHVHGLYPTYLANAPADWFTGNRFVLESVKQAKAVSVPSRWVAQQFERDMHFTPHVIPWGVDLSEWYPQTANVPYVLWNKTRVDLVCNPKPVNDVAKLIADMRFLTTFAADGKPDNVNVLGKMPHADMQKYIRGAHLYLATTKETFGIGTLEAMASGVPVVGYRHGAIVDMVTHGVNGFLVEPNDIEGLAAGIRWASQHRAVLGANARLAAGAYTWQHTAQQIARVYDDALAPRAATRVSVIIPVHNYAHFLGDAINSVLENRTDFAFEIIVVDDGSTDNSVDVAYNCLRDAGVPYGVIQLDNGGVSRARNIGTHHASGTYITFLDADDQLGDPRFLQTLADALDADRTLGIAFAGLRTMSADGVVAPTVNGFPRGYDFDRQTFGHNQVPTCCMVRKEAVTRAGGFRSQYWAGEDANLWLRIGALGYRAQQVTQEGWFHYRVHEDSLTHGLRTGSATPPKWNDLTWVNDLQRPFAADGQPVKGSWTVREYDKPQISFIVPVSSAHRHLVQRALDSIENQSFRQWEVILVNDTTSGKPLSLAGYPFVRVIDTGGGIGASAARNLGVKHASAPLIAFLDADDMLHPAWSQKTLNHFNKTGNYVYTDHIAVNADGSFTETKALDYDPMLALAPKALHLVTVLMRKRDFERVGGFDESQALWEDMEFFARCATLGVCGSRLAEPLLYYDLRTGVQRAQAWEQKDDLFNALKDKFAEYREGRKVCGCLNKPTGVSIASPEPASDYVRIEYTGGIAGHDVTGAATGTFYGYRKRGDVFYIDALDQKASRFFALLPERTVTEVEPLTLPDAPTLLAQEVSA